MHTCNGTTPAVDSTSARLMTITQSLHPLGSGLVFLSNSFAAHLSAVRRWSPFDDFESTNMVTPTNFFFSVGAIDLIDERNEGEEWTATTT